MSFSILQWNSRYIFKKRHEFKNYLSALDDLPDVLCIQESHLTPKYQPSIPDLQVIRKDRPLSKGKGGGLMVCVKISLDFSNIDVALQGSSNLEVLGIAVHGFSIFNIYNPPPTPRPPPPLIFYPTLQKWFSVLIFNAHHGMCGSDYKNCSGRSLAEALDVHDLVVLNTTTPTHLSRTGRNAWSLLELVLVSSSYAYLCTCTVTSEFLGSDHYCFSKCQCEHHAGKPWCPEMELLQIRLAEI